MPFSHSFVKVIAHQEAHTFRHASSSAFSLLLLFTDAHNSPKFKALWFYRLHLIMLLSTLYVITFLILTFSVLWFCSSSVAKTVAGFDLFVCGMYRIVGSAKQTSQNHVIIFHFAALWMSKAESISTLFPMFFYCKIMEIRVGFFFGLMNKNRTEKTYVW